jgi:Spy/CpxP family protein refolding chaperone
MKKQSYLALTLAVLAASAAGAQARDTTRSAERTGAAEQRGDRPQGGRRNDGRPRRDPFLRGIQLSDAQRQRIDAIDAKHRREREAARDAGSEAGAPRGDREAGRERMREAMDRHATEVRTVLTPAQQQQFDRNREEMRARMQERGPGKRERGGDGRRGGGERGA